MANRASIPLSRRSLLVAVAIAVFGGAAAFRYLQASDDDDYFLDARVAQRQYLRHIAGRVTQYARIHHRPAFHLDSVAAHLDSAEGARFRGYLVDLWGDPVAYVWGWESFTLTSRAGTTMAGMDAAYDSVAAAERARALPDSGRFARFEAVNRRLFITETYGWPEEATPPAPGPRPRTRTSAGTSGAP